MTGTTGKCILLLLLSLALVTAAVAAEKKPAARLIQPQGTPGRLLYYSEAGDVEILVLTGDESGGKVPCRKFGSRKAIEVQSGSVKATPFCEDVSPLTVTQWMLYAYAHGRRYDWERALADRIGDESGRMAMVVEFEIACNNFMNGLKKLSLKFNEDWTEEDFTDSFSDMWIDDNPINDVIRKALNGEDRILAIALLEAYRAFLKENSKYFSATPGGSALCQETIQGLMAEYLEHFNEAKRQSSPRQKRFQKLFPQARSLWSEAPPTTYGLLVKSFDRSLKAFVQLDNLSVLTEPEEWGSAMLDVLLMVEGSAAGEELEKEFDAELGEMEKNLHKKQPATP